MNRYFISVFCLMALAGCSTPRQAVDSAAGANPPGATLSQFSSGEAGRLPKGWEPMILLREKKRTQYQLVRQQNETVLHAYADAASSGLMQPVRMNPDEQPWLHWRWKIAKLIKTADNTQRATEDSAVRIILGFDGDKETLSFTDQILFDTAKLLTGYDFPYATLMYIWENKAPVGTIIRSPHSGRIRMVVAAHGEEGIGEWREFTRNIVEDFEQAYGEKPGKLIGVGVLTDTDNTGETVEAWYGDIRLLRSRMAEAGNEAHSVLVGQRK